MNIREISDVFKDTAGDIEALKSYNFGWASDRVRQGNTEDFQELNAFPRVFFSVPTITASDQIRKQDTYQVTLFFDDLLGYDNEGDADLTLQIDKWAALQQYATAFIQRLNLIKQSILPNYLFIPEPPQFTFDSFVGIQRLVTVQVNFNLVVPTNCEVTVKRIIELVGNAIATGTSQANIFLSTSVSAFIECKATATGFIVTGQQNIIEVDASVTAFALASGDIVRVQNVSATTIATATAQAEVQRAVNIIAELNASGQVSGNINLTLFATGSATGTATVDANLEVTTQGIVECEANVTGTSVTSGSLFVIRTLEAQSVAEATSQSQIILSKLLSGVASGFAVADANINLGLNVDASIQGNATTEANIQRLISLSSSIDTTVTTSAEAQITRVLNAEATATANTEASAQLTIPVTAQAMATAESSADAQLTYSVNATATAIAETSADAQITRIISAEATATAKSSADANFGITFNAGIEATANVVNANATRTATLAASVSGAATVTNATLTVPDADATAFISRVTTAGGSLTATEQTAIRTLVADLKSNGIWDKMTVIYPMVGGGQANPADACKQNLKSSSFTGTFSSGWTFTSGGVKGSGTTGVFMDTGFKNSNFPNYQSTSLYYYGDVGTNAASWDTGNINATPNARFAVPPSDNQVYFQFNGDDLFSVTHVPRDGFFGMNRINDSQINVFANNTKLTTVTSNLIANSNTNNYAIASQFSAGNLSNSDRLFKFYSLGTGLTDTESANFYTVVQAFQTTLSRQV
jgi:hypothetical protein